MEKRKDAKMNIDHIVIYHNKDFDGLVSAGLFKHKYPNAKFVGWDYTSFEEEWNLLDNIKRIIHFFKMENPSIYFVDVRPKQNEILYDLTAYSDNIVIIDHHKKIYEETKDDLANAVDYVFRNDQSAAMTVYDFLWYRTNHEDKLLEQKIRYVSDYDIWNHADLNTVYFQNFLLTSLFFNITNEANYKAFHTIFFTDLIKLDDMLNVGKTIESYKITKANKDFERFCVVEKGVAYHNGTPEMSYIDRELLNGVALYIIYYYVIDNSVKMSLRGVDKDVDVAEIASQWKGGGGHKGAAGALVSIDTFFNDIYLKL